MKRSPYMLVLSLPFMLGAATPPFRPLPSPQAPANHVVEINVIDRFLQDTGIRKRPTQSKRSRSRTQSGSAIPKPPALASVPVPMARPANGTEPTEIAAQASPAEEKQNTKADTAETTMPTAKPTQTDQPPAAETSSQGAAPPEREISQTADSDNESATKAKPETDDAAASTQTPPAETATPPLVEQPATASEPARQSEVPTPLSKPEADTAASGTGSDEAEQTDADRETATQDDAKEDATGTETAKPDAKPADQQSDEQKAETEPPPPLIKEDPRELQACLTDLKAIGATFETTDPIDDGNGCGIENPIDVKQVLPGVDLGGATMRCKTALTMAHWLKETAQPALAIAMPGRRITGLVPGSTYQCRLRNSASTGKISEHARGNAYDVAAFKLDNGETIEMKPRTEDSTLEGAFQRTATAGACLHFTTVLSPGSDAAHQDHLHLDILERDGGYRYCR